MGVACVFLLPSRAESLVLLCCKREIEAPSRDKETELRDEREKRLFFREGGRGYDREDQWFVSCFPRQRQIVGSNESKKAKPPR